MATASSSMSSRSNHNKGIWNCSSRSIGIIVFLNGQKEAAVTINSLNSSNSMGDQFPRTRSVLHGARKKEVNIIMISSLRSEWTTGRRAHRTCGNFRHDGTQRSSHEEEEWLYFLLAQLDVRRSVDFIRLHTPDECLSIMTHSPKRKLLLEYN